MNFIGLLANAPTLPKASRNPSSIDSIDSMPYALEEYCIKSSNKDSYLLKPTCISKPSLMLSDNSDNLVNIESTSFKTSVLIASGDPSEFLVLSSETEFAVVGALACVLFVSEAFAANSSNKNNFFVNFIIMYFF